MFKNFYNKTKLVKFLEFLLTEPGTMVSQLLQPQNSGEEKIKHVRSYKN